MEKIPALNGAVAYVIHTLRTKSGLSQGQLAGLAGLSEEYISAVERGLQIGSLTALMHISSALGISASDIVKQIENAMKEGVTPPARKAGKPRKSKV